MSVVFFALLFVILSVAVSLITEAVKAFLDNEKIKYSANVVVLIVALIVGAGGTALAYIFLGIAFTMPNVVCIFLMAVATWVGAMVGYDKVLQMIDQIKALKLK
jgi:hypothetical protein